MNHPSNCELVHAAYSAVVLLTFQKVQVVKAVSHRFKNRRKFGLELTRIGPTSGCPVNFLGHQVKKVTLTSHLDNFQTGLISSVDIPFTRISRGKVERELM